MAGDALLAKVAAVHLGDMVLSHATNVMGAEAPALAGDECGGDLTAKHDLGVESLDFGAQLRKLCNLQNGVSGVFADAEDVEAWGRHKVVVQGNGRAGKCKAG